MTQLVIRSDSDSDAACVQIVRRQIKLYPLLMSAEGRERWGGTRSGKYVRADEMEFLLWNLQEQRRLVRQEQKVARSQVRDHCPIHTVFCRCFAAKMGLSLGDILPCYPLVTVSCPVRTRQP